MKASCMMHKTETRGLHTAADSAGADGAAADSVAADGVAADGVTIDEVRRLYTTGDAAHDFDHVARVVALAVHLAAAEGADVEVVRLAALLHDVPVEHMQTGDVVDAAATREAHHLAAARFAGGFLRGRGMDRAAVDNVVHCIQAHRFRDQSIQPQTLEAKCLYDADKLDSMGAIGVARAFAFAGAHDNRLWTEPSSAVPPQDAAPEGGDYTPVHEYVYKLARLLDTLHTPTAKAIGAERHAFMVAFFTQLDREVLRRA